MLLVASIMGTRGGTWRPVEEDPSRRRQLQPLEHLWVHLHRWAVASASVLMPKSQTRCSGTGTEQQPSHSCYCAVEGPMAQVEMW